MSPVANYLHAVPGSPRQWLNGVLIALAIWLLVSIVLLWLPREAPGTQQNVVAAAPGNASAQALRLTWFSGARGSVIQQVDREELEEASVQAELLGVVLSGDRSTATIKFGTRPESVYRVGDKLGSAVELKQIESYRVVVSERGVRRQISLNKADKVMQAVDPSDRDAGADRRGFGVNNLFGAVPVQTDEYGAGIELDQVTGELQEFAAVRPGDVVVQVGDLSVSELATNPQALSEMENQTSVPVTVLRDGEEMVIYVNAAGLSARLLPGIQRSARTRARNE